MRNIRTNGPASTAVRAIDIVFRRAAGGGNTFSTERQRTGAWRQTVQRKATYPSHRRRAGRHAHRRSDRLHRLLGGQRRRTPRRAPSSSASPAPPGRYRTLPEPCGSVDVGTLKKLLPGAGAAESEGDGEGSGKGRRAAPTPPRSRARRRHVRHGPSRRLPLEGREQSRTPDHLAVDFERVVSYDPAVSDDEQASSSSTTSGPGRRRSRPRAALPRTTAAKDPAATKATKPPTRMTAARATAARPTARGATARAEVRNPTVTPLSPGRPRRIPHLRLTPTSRPVCSTTSATGLYRRQVGHRRLRRPPATVTLVFRTSNVIATVEYDQRLTRQATYPGQRGNAGEGPQCGRESRCGVR